MPRATPTLSTAVDLSCHSPRNSGDTGPPPPIDELSTFNAEADAHNASAPKGMTVARPDVEVSYTVTQLGEARGQLTNLSAEPVPEAVLVAFNAEADAHNASAPKGMTVARPDVEVSYTVTQLGEARGQLTNLSAEPVPEAVLVAFNAEADAYNASAPKGMTGARCMASR